MAHLVSWEMLRDFVTSRAVVPQWYELDGQYQITAVDGAISLEASIPKTVPENDQQLDFETNFLTNSNNNVSRVHSDGSVLATWSDFKSFATELGPVLHLSCASFATMSIIWAEFRGQMIRCRISKSDTSTHDDFVANWKSKCNRKEADRVRITTCQQGRKLSSRYISFKTALPGSLDNTDENGLDFGDVVYSMRDASNVVTTDPTLAVKTIIDFNPAFDYEVSGGAIYIPETLAGNDDEAWEIHAIGAPDIPASYGGRIPFVANNRIHWLRGGKLDLDASLNPADISGALNAYARKIRFVLLHPVGAVSPFQINFKVFK